MALPARLKRSRHGIYYFRVVIPMHMRPFLGGRTEIKKTLHTREPREARQWAYALNAQLGTLLWGGVTGMGKRYDPAKFNEHDRSTWPTNQDELTRWEADFQRGIFKADPSIPGDQEGLMALVAKIEATGATFVPPPQSLPVADIAKEVAAAVREAVQALPTGGQNLTKIGLGKAVASYKEHLPRVLFNSKTRQKYDAALDEFVASAGERVLYSVDAKMIVAFKRSQNDKKRAVGTINTKLSAIKGFLEWAQQELYFPKGELPTEGQWVAEKQDESGKKASGTGRKPLSIADLRAFFEPTLYRKQLGKQPQWFWGPILALYTGARIEEICQLHREDFEVVDGLVCMRVDSRDDKGVKTEAGIRCIPLHPMLKELGFFDFLTDMRETFPDDPHLFPFLPPDKHDIVSGSTSAKLNRYMQLSKVHVPDVKVFHSFRHTANQELADRRVSLEYRCRLIGHDINNSNESYTEPVPMTNLFEAGIGRMIFEKELPDGTRTRLDLSPLKYEKGSMVQLVRKLMKTKPKDSARRKETAKQAMANGVDYKTKKPRDKRK